MPKEKFGRKKERKSFDCHGECRKNNAVGDKVEEIISMADYETDPYGSYTGVPKDRGEKPMQDADDL